jgi:hypothetical protein
MMDSCGYSEQAESVLALSYWRGAVSEHIAGAGPGGGLENVQDGHHGACDGVQYPRK